MLQRTLLPFAFALIALAGQAQTASYTFFQASEPVDRNDLKLIIEEVRSVDPLAEVFISDDGTIIQMKGNASVAEHRTALQQAGVALMPGTVDPSTLEPGGTIEGPPVFLVTDDAAADLERYQEARAVWNAAHPDQQVGLPLHLNEQ